jgi:N-acetylglucosamine malate deacetylase 2
MGCILLILAHPDDETFYAGGTIAKYAGAGERVAIVCATRGQRGSTAGLCSIEELPAVREGELRQAAARLGVADSDVHVLEYEDQKVAEAEPKDIHALLSGFIRRLHPTVVITFNPSEPNQHTDHLAVGRFAMEAAAALLPQRVVWIAGFENNPGVDYLIDIAPHRNSKEAALRAHRTQWPGLRRFFFDGGKPNRRLNFEAFRTGAGPAPARGPVAVLL